MSDQPHQTPPKTPPADSAQEREKALAQSRATWIEKRQERLAQQKAKAEQAHKDALSEMRRPKNKRR